MAADRIELRVRRKKFPLIYFLLFFIFHFFATEREREREGGGELFKIYEHYFLVEMSVVYYRHRNHMAAKFGVFVDENHGNHFALY